MAVVGAVYTRVFLPDSVVDDGLSAPIISEEKLYITKPDGESTRNSKSTQLFKRMPSLEDMVCLLKTRSVNFNFGFFFLFFWFLERKTVLCLANKLPYTLLLFEVIIFSQFAAQHFPKLQLLRFSAILQMLAFMHLLWYFTSLIPWITKHISFW